MTSGGLMSLSELTQQRELSGEQQIENQHWNFFHYLNQQDQLREQQNEYQDPPDNSLSFVQPDGVIAQVMGNSGKAVSYIVRERIDDDADILRFQKSERLLHWALSIPFMICWITALILILVYNPDPSRPYRIILATVHRISGLCLFILPALVLYSKRDDLRIHLDNIKEAWIWSLNDLKWLFLMGFAAISKKIVLPPQGKFNAAEKVNFMMVMVGWVVFSLTGILIMIQSLTWLAWLIHAIVALIVSPIMLGHIYMATVNPETRKGISGMISGYVSRQWAQHHYAQWYNQKFESETRNDPNASDKK